MHGPKPMIRVGVASTATDSGAGRNAGLALVLLLALACAGSPTVAGEIETAFEQFSAAVENSTLKNEALSDLVAEYHHTHFDRQPDWDQLSAGQLEAEFKAADLAAFHTMSPVFVDRMREALQRLESHGVATPAHYRMLHGDFLLAGMYEQARDLSARFPALSLPTVPSIVGEDEALGDDEAFLLARSKTLLQLVRRPVVQGLEIVVISHPLCNFSMRAFEQITADPELRELFARQATWVSPPQRKLHTKHMLRWAEHDPTQRILQAYRPKPGSIFRTRATPTFFFIENGRVTGTLVGWPGDEQLGVLKARLAELRDEVGPGSRPSFEAPPCAKKMPGLPSQAARARPSQFN